MKKILLMITMFFNVVLADSEVNQKMEVDTIVLLNHEETSAKFLIWTTIDRISTKESNINKLCSDLKLECSFKPKTKGLLVHAILSATGSKSSISTFVLSLQ